MIGLRPLPWLAALLVSGGLSAEPLLERAVDRGVLNVCSGDEFPPFKFLDAQGRPAGLIPDLIDDLHRQLATATGKALTLRLVQVNPVNRILFLQQGGCDLLMTSMLDTPARREQVDIASPGFYQSAATVFAPRASVLADWSSLRGKTLCAPATSVWIRPLEERYGVRFISFNGSAEVRKAVADQRCLGALGDDVLYRALAATPGWEDYEVKLPGQDPAPWGIAVRKGQPQLLSALSRVVEGWHAEGLIIALEHHYGLAPSPWLVEQQQARQAVARHD